MIVALLQLPTGAHLPGVVCILLALLATTAIGLFQGSIVALVGVPSFVVTLAGFLIWQGVILRTITQGVIVIQNNTINNMYGYFFSDLGGWIIGIAVSALYVAVTLGAALSARRHGIPIRDPFLLALKVRVRLADHARDSLDLNKDRGVPFALLLVVAMLLVLTFLAKRTMFGRHVYAVGGNAEAARRAGINVARIRILVFMISGLMAGHGRHRPGVAPDSVDLNAGGGTLLIDSIAAAVIGRHEPVRRARRGPECADRLGPDRDDLQRHEHPRLLERMIYIVTGSILLLAVTFDTIVRRAQVRSGR